MFLIVKEVSLFLEVLISASNTHDSKSFKELYEKIDPKPIHTTQKR